MIMKDVDTLMSAAHFDARMTDIVNDKVFMRITDIDKISINYGMMLLLL